MKLSEADRENIEVLEALEVDEPTLLLLLYRYFAFRSRSASGKAGLPPNAALAVAIRASMGRVNTCSS